MATIIDPPSGWMYGFPKPIPEDRKKDVKTWLIEQGYPKERIDDLGEHFYCRYWEQSEENEKEKAIELVNSFDTLGRDFTRGVSMKEFAKECALTSVDKIYSALYDYLKDTDELQNADREFAYWEQVKQEIQKL